MKGSLNTMLSRQRRHPCGPFVEGHLCNCVPWYSSSLASAAKSNMFQMYALQRGRLSSQIHEFMEKSLILLRIVSLSDLSSEADEASQLNSVSPIEVPDGLYGKRQERIRFLHVSYDTSRNRDCIRQCSKYTTLSLIGRKAWQWPHRAVHLRHLSYNALLFI